MSGKSLRTGGEVDSYCTKCRMILNHRIIAMLGQNPVRVECSTCGSHHNFRARMPGEKAPAKPGVVRAPRETKAVQESRAIARERELTQSWEKAVSGKGMTDFKPYRTNLTFETGQLIRHSKFGDGVVSNVIDAQKIEILFKDGPKTLAHGLV